MMKKKTTLVFMATLAFALVSAQGAFAQVDGYEDFEDEIEMINEVAEGDPESLLIKLSLSFDADLVMLRDLYTEGYAPGEIWLALEVASSAEISLQDALILTDGSEGHGWGVLAKILNIAPGSDAFHELKLKWGENNGALVREMNHERNNQPPKGDKDKASKNDNGKSEDSGAEDSKGDRKVGKK